MKPPVEKKKPAWLLVQQWFAAPGSWRVLHFIAAPEAWNVLVEPRSLRGRSFTSACGLRTRFDLPGLFSRMGTPRCQRCCKSLGIPWGHGSGANDPALKEFARKQNRPR